MVRIAVGQTEPKVVDGKSTYTELKGMLASATEASVDVLVLPELANSGYAFESLEEARGRAERIPDGPACRILSKWSAKGRLVVAGICESSGKNLYNSAVAFAAGEHLCTYRKLHLFARESNWFTRGGKEPPVFKFQDNRYGIMICYDWAFPETARILALKDAQVILHPSNLILTFCQNAMVTRSLENGVFTATANRIGYERGLAFTGRSQITGTRGEIIARASQSKTELAWADIDPSGADDKMITKQNHILEDRRPEAYGRLVKVS